MSKVILKKHLGDAIDDDTLEYFESMITSGSVTDEGLRETLAPFIESYGLAEADLISGRIVDELHELNIMDSRDDRSDVPQLLEKSVLLSDVANNHLDAQDKANLETLWGFANVRKNRNGQIVMAEMSEAGSAKYERRAAKEQRKWLDELESQFVGEEDNNNVSTMMLPDLTGKSNDKDIHVHNFNITYGGKLLLESADLRLVYGRRYGLIGRNGIGKVNSTCTMVS
jgi:hypothetical protein